MVLTGLGIHLGLATTLLVYTLTIMAALVGPLPGGIGVADASLGALLIANGVSGPAAAGAVIAFRLLDLWLPLFVGAVAGAHHWHRREAVGQSAESRSWSRCRRRFRCRFRRWSRSATDVTVAGPQPHHHQREHHERAQPEV